MNFIKAEINDKEKLRCIAYTSEAYWGYNEEFMSIFNDKFNITDEFITNNPVFIGIDNDNIVCFWGAICEKKSCELEYFYVEEKSINKGLGKIMWQNFIAWCIEQNIADISFVTSPQAIGFYQRMGATLMGETLSIIDNRPIPKFIYHFK